MFWWLILAVALLLLGAAAAYRIRAAWWPFTSGSGRRRLVYWLRGWWRGEQAQNRDDSWT